MPGLGWVARDTTSDAMGHRATVSEWYDESVGGATDFTQWDNFTDVRDLLPHELVHSWNGKFRRPAELLIPNFNVPMRDSLLWVYEGQTQYWGYVLSARSGLWTKQEALDGIAWVAARGTRRRSSPS